MRLSLYVWLVLLFLPTKIPAQNVQYNNKAVDLGLRSTRKVNPEYAGDGDPDTAGPLSRTWWGRHTAMGDRVYDAENRMTKALGGTNQWQEYAYNAEGQRVRRKIDSLT